MNEEKPLEEKRQRWATVPIEIQKRVFWTVATLTRDADSNEPDDVFTKVRLTFNLENGDVVHYHLTGEHVFDDPHRAFMAARMLNFRNFGNYIEL